MERAVIRVPVVDGMPDWQWIDGFEAGIERRASATLSHAIVASADKGVFANLEGWGRFAIGDLFDIAKGSRLTKAEMRDGDICFIGSSAMNNGVTRLIANDEHLHPAGVLTVCYNGSVGETFYQDERFWASDDVNVLYPKFDMDFQLAMFIAPLIKQRSRCYSYIDKWKLADMDHDEILLPADSEGTPDWPAMREFATKRIAHSLAALKCLAAST